MDLLTVDEDEAKCRALVDERSKGMCEVCSDAAPLDKAHRRARSQGGAWEAANIIDACRACHRANHANPATAYENHWHLRAGQDPSTTPALLTKHGRTDWILLSNDGTWRWADEAREAPLQQRQEAQR